MPVNFQQQTPLSLTEAFPLEHIKYMHFRLMKKFHPDREVGKTDVMKLLDIFSKAGAEFGGKRLFLDIIDQSAYIWREMTLQKPFIDGNKRLSYMVVLRWLYLNGYTIKVKQPEIIQMCMATEDEDEPMEKLIVWLRKVVKEVK